MNINCAVIGYGPSFNMGKYHCELIEKTRGLNLVAICDKDYKRTVAAKEDFPIIKTYNSLTNMLKNQEINLVVIVTPHNTHAKIAVQALKSGKNVVVEKPMCITTKEASNMIDEAKKRNLMLSVFQNRRFDGDFLALKEVVNKEIIGDVFLLERYSGGYSHPGYWWRSNKTISGGAFYDMGAHYIDQILKLIPKKMLSVTGFIHKLVWKDVTNEDQVEAIIRFESNIIAKIQLSDIASVGKPGWRILGTKGGIISENKGSEKYFKVVGNVEGIHAEMKIKYKESDYSIYYRNISDHLLNGTELYVKPEESRRVIAVMETAEKSSKSEKTEYINYN
jgi:predicted dehydrogenase